MGREMPGVHPFICGPDSLTSNLLTQQLKNNAESALDLGLDNICCSLSQGFSQDFINTCLKF